jgi:hypothetical protein
MRMSVWISFADLRFCQPDPRLCCAQLPIRGTIELAFIVSEAMDPVLFLKRFGGRAKDVDKTLVGCRVGGCAEHHAVVKDKGAKGHEEGLLLGKSPLPLSQSLIWPADLRCLFARVVSTSPIVHSRL